MKNARLPFVFLNLAMSADGKIATANRSVHSCGSARDLEHLYELRATADAILCGARTVEDTQALLGNGGEKYRRRRLQNGLAEYPVRVLVSGTASVDAGAPIFGKRFSPLILLASARAPAGKLTRLRARVDELKIFGKGEVDFRAALVWLREKWNVNRLLCEGGGELNDALFRAGLVDEIHVTICPKIFGGRTAPTIADGSGFQRLGEAACFKLTSFRRVKDELFTVFSRPDSR